MNEKKVENKQPFFAKYYSLVTANQLYKIRPASSARGA